MSNLRSLGHCAAGAIFTVMLFANVRGDDVPRKIDVGRSAEKSFYIVRDKEAVYPATTKARQLLYERTLKRTLTPDKLVLRGDGYLKGTIQIPRGKWLEVTEYYTGDGIDESYVTPRPIDLKPLGNFRDGDIYGFGAHPYFIQLVNGAALETLCRFQSIRKLVIMPAKGIQSVSMLRNLKQIDVFAVLEVEADDFLDANDAIPAIASRTQLRYLHFHGSKVTDKALEAFRELERLEVLYVRGNKSEISAAGVDALHGMPSLREIEVGPRFDESIQDEAILGFRRLPNLERLRIGPVPHVSDKAIQSVREKFPGADIEIYNRPRTLNR